MSDDRETEEYEVGYGRPPESGKFKRGTSGNPSGRPKKASDFEAKLLRELNSSLVITEHGKRKVITKDEGIAKQVVNKALSGHVPTLRLVDNLRRQAIEKAGDEELRASQKLILTADDLTDKELTFIVRQQQAEREKAAQGAKTTNNSAMRHVTKVVEARLNANLKSRDRR